MNDKSGEDDPLMLEQLYDTQHTPMSNIVNLFALTRLLLKN